MRRVIGAIGTIILALVAWTVYANVISSDPAVLARAERLADDACGPTCKHTRTEATSSILGKTFAFTYPEHGVIVVKCRRPYFAFGAFNCTAAK